MAIKLATGELLPRHDSYDSDAIARAFWRLTYETGRKYIYGIDASGGKVLIPHEREKEGYSRRQKMTKPRNHAGPIIRRYNNHVFRTEAQRPESTSELYQMLLVDTDGHGTNINAFMSKALEAAQVDRDSYLMLDSTKSDDGEISKAQAEANGVRPIIRILNADSVVNWIEHDECLTQVLIVMVDENGDRFARLYDEENYIQITLKQETGRKDVIASVDAPVAHGYDGLPIIRMRPFCGESQISPLAESQQCITNLMSWLIEEMANVTFSQMVASGVSATDIGDMYVGNNRVICLPNPAAKFEMIGADPAQAQSLRDAIKDEERELYRVAGIQSDDPTKAGAPESGIAKAFKHNDLSANLSALAACVETAENSAMTLLFDSVGEPYPGDVKFPDDFDLPNIADDLSEVISAVSIMALPNTIKTKITERFAQRHLSLDDAEQRQLEGEMSKMSNDQLTNQPSGMQGT